MRRTVSLIVCFVLLLGMPLSPLGATTGTVAPFPKHVFLNNNGEPCTSCLVFTYLSGSSTKVSTFTDVNLSSSNTNPIVLDSSGRATIFLTPGVSYKFILSPSSDSDPPAAPIWTVDGVGAVPPTGTATDVDIQGVAGEGISAGDAVALSDGSGGGTAGRWYKADADSTFLSSTAQAVGFAIAAITTGSTGTIRRGGKITALSGLTAGTLYFVSATGGALTSTAPTNARAILQADSTTTGVILTGEPEASSTLRGIVNLGTQTLGTGTKTVDGLTSNAAITYKPGTAASAIATGSGILGASVDTAQHANSGTGLTDMSSYTLPANVLANTNTVLLCHAAGTLAANANVKTLYFKFGATSSAALFNGGINGTDWALDAMVFRTGAATQKIKAEGRTRSTGADLSIDYFTAAETLSGAITIKTQSQSGTASSDIIQEVFYCEVSGG
jgi:hypothetical protein